MSGTFNVRDYGAIANDGIDDRVAIQKALDAASAAGGGTVILGSGVYAFARHEQPLTLTIKTSVAHGKALDGFVADYITGGTYETDIALNNDRHGFNICTSSSNVKLLNDTAYGNGSAGVCVQRGSD